MNSPNSSKKSISKFKDSSLKGDEIVGGKSTPLNQISISTEDSSIETDSNMLNQINGKVGYVTGIALKTGEDLLKAE